MRADQLRPDDDNHAAPKRNRGGCEVGRKGKAQTFERKLFRASRLADFATETELTKQTGQPVENWPLAVVKELIDNALDEAEHAGTAPVIEVIVAQDTITVTDRGRGIAPATVKAIVDYSFRMSSNAAYVSPTRGQQGNALQILFAMPYVLNSKEGEVLIESRGVAHTIRFTTDPVRQTPVVSRATSPSAIKNGTRITMRWPERACSLLTDANHGFLSLTEHYSWFNPHLTLSFNDAGWQATDPDWSKWQPSMPTSAHWYDADRLKLWMTSEIAHAEDHRAACLTVRDFIGQFRGLSATAKRNAICSEIGIAERETLADFYRRHGAAAASRLLIPMRAASRPVKPRDLGVIGHDHLIERMIDDDCELASVVYQKREFDHDGMPYMIETAFGYRPGDDETKYGLRVIEGFNFSPAIGDSPFQLERRLENADVENEDPVTVFLHLTAPHLNFLDRGKARVALPDPVNEALFGMVTGVTKAWTKQKRVEIRDAQAVMRRHDAMVRRSKPMTIIEAAYEAMPAAYQLASDDGEGGHLPVKPRQIMYRARPHILARTGKQTFDDDYFTQEILVGFMKAHPGETADWDIIWDDRGHFAEPHTDHMIGLGTLPVREYLANLREPEIVPAAITDAHVSTFGPAGRYHGVLFNEKEGFEPIFEAAGVYARYDLAPMSTKGMSVTAGRMLVEELCGRRGLPLFVLHDFDKSGFSIHQTLISDTDRYAFDHALDNVVEIGLRLTDIERFVRDGEPLQSEAVAFGKNENLEKTADRLRINGATEDEIAFMLSPAPDHTTGGQRVELNAMTSAQLVALVETALEAHGLTKVVPNKDMLAETYAALKRGAMARQALEAELARLNAEPIDVPADLAERVRAYLAEHPKETWDAAIRGIVSG